MHSRLSILIVLMSVSFASEARAEFLPGEARAISLQTSASRDAPVLEIADGPTPQLSLGGELGLWRRRGQLWDLHVSATALAAFESGETQDGFPNSLLVVVDGELLRVLFGVTASFARPAPNWLGGRGTLELSIGFGREQAYALDGYPLPVLTRPDGIPFGGGGTFVDPTVAWRFAFGNFEFTFRLADRIHLPGFIQLFGQTEAADLFADATNDALSHQPMLDATVRWRLAELWQPLLSAHEDVLVPLDASARDGSFTRVIAGVACRGELGELLPFVSGDIGNGQGWLINQHEARLSFGVRYVGF
jgi:hypothetical protein